MVEKAPDRKTRRRLRTRQQLLDATESLLLQRGYDETTAEAIAELADLGRSTFYNHFNNKRDAVLATIEARYARYGQEAWVPFEHCPDRAVSMTISTRRVFKDIAGDPLTRQLVDRPGLLVQAFAESQADMMNRDLDNGLEQGRFSFFISYDRLIVSLYWSHIGLLIQGIMEDSVDSYCMDWCRILLLHLGIDRAEIDQIIDTAQGELQRDVH